jgi:hypothetical protein
MKDSGNEAIAGASPGLLQEFAEGVFIAEGPTVNFCGRPYPTRSVVIRVIASSEEEGYHVNDETITKEPNNASTQNMAWMWSPVAYSKELADEVEHKVGPVKFIVSPNKIHHLFLGEWSEKYPDAVVYLPPGLRIRTVIEGKLPWLDDPTRVIALIPIEDDKEHEKPS